MSSLTNRQILDIYMQACRSVEEEFIDQPLEVVKGSIPRDLQGYLFRNGAGRFENYGVPYDHPFDGDGMVSRFHFREGQVFYSNRYVRTREFQAEAEAQKMLYRSFGTNLPGGIAKNFLRMQFKNAANTSLVYHGGKMLALWEGGLPHEISPHTLETIGRYDYEEELKNAFSKVDQIISPELPFSAHPKKHPLNGVLYNFGTASGAKNRLMTYQISPEGRLANKMGFEMKGIPFVHDFVLTENGDQVFFLTSVRFDLWRTLIGLKTPVDSIQADTSAPNRIWVIRGDQKMEFLTNSGFIFHHANGFARDQNRLVVDALLMAQFPSAEATGSLFEDEAFQNIPAYLTRYEINLNSREVQHQRISDYPMELPTIHPQKVARPYRYVWAIGTHPERANGLLHGIVKVDTQTKKSSLHDFYPHLTGEPILVPKADSKDEDEGWLLSLLFDVTQKKTRLLVMNAQDLEVIAEAVLPHCLPLGFHGLWLDQLA